MDPTFVGTWRCEDPTEGSAQVAALVVMPFDRSQYYLEWRDGDSISRYSAYSTSVHGETLFNVRELKSEPAAARWTLFRAARRSDGTLYLSVVNKDSLEDAREPAALKEVARRVKSEALYAPWAVCTMEK